MRRNGTIKKQKKGFTLIELVVVIAILSILAAILIPFISEWIKTAQEEVCTINKIKIGQYYQAQLVLDDIEHRDILFEQFCQGYGESALVEAYTIMLMRM